MGVRRSLWVVLMQTVIGRRFRQAARSQTEAGELGECEGTDLAVYVDNQSATDLPVHQIDGGWKSRLKANLLSHQR